jgi:hypothetical protein
MNGEDSRPWNGASQVLFWGRVDGVVLPIVASDDQYCVRFPDGTQLWIEKWDVHPLKRDRDEVEIARMKEQEMRRMRQNGHRNNASPDIELKLALERLRSAQAKDPK